MPEGHAVFVSVPLGATEPRSGVGMHGAEIGRNGRVAAIAAPREPTRSSYCPRDFLEARTSSRRLLLRVSSVSRRTRLNADELADRESERGASEPIQRGVHDASTLRSEMS